jgi:oxygen-independent coproporphyrinogen-3 oxidase
VSFSLYIHIPWCQAKCPYCDFNSYAAASWPEAEYTGALIGELRRRAQDAVWAQAGGLKTIFFGGGTPSLFKPESIGLLLEAAHRIFGVEDHAEITLEANPGTVELEKLRGFRAAGVNRISFGAQSFNPRTLKFLGRIHDADQTRRCVCDAHRAGFERINLDLIFAVPGQTAVDVSHDVEQAAALDPGHISAYNLTFEEGTPFFSDMSQGRIRPLENDEQAAMYALVRQELPARGYGMYEISNYARPGHEARHNLSYWRAESYLGIGAGAHSFARGGPGGRRWWNERSPSRYIGRIGKSGIAEAGSENVDARTAAGEFVFLNLRLIEGFSLADFSSRFGQSFESIFGTVSQRLIEEGLLLCENERICLSQRGLEMADTVFSEFV